MARTQEEIVTHINAIKGKDLLGFQISELIEDLDFEHAKQFLKPEATAEGWSEHFPAQKTPRQRLIDYMPFAWEKANNCRGISANRSIEHCLAWMWLDESPLLPEVQRMYAEEYEYYGKDILVKICENYGVDWKSLDDGRRTNTDE